MIKKYNRWYQALKPPHQLIFSFILNWPYWFLAYWIGQELIFNEKNSLSYSISLSLYMSFFMTLIMNWKKATGLYRSLRKRETNSGG